MHASDLKNTSQTSPRLALINRAVPGSGKSSMTRYLLDQFNTLGHSCAVHSTDEFFITPEGRYAFDIRKLYDFHTRNLEQFRSSLRAGTDVVICDNINLLPWQTEPYTEVARAEEYHIVFLSFSPGPLEKHIDSQQVTAERPDAHGVPESVLIRFIEDYYKYTPLLDPRTPVCPGVHHHYIWDQQHQRPVPAEAPCKRFDLDAYVHVHPYTFDAIKPDLGQRLIEWSNGGNRAEHITDVRGFTSSP